MFTGGLVAQHPIDAGPADTQPVNDFRGRDAIGFESDDVGSLSPSGRYTALLARPVPRHR
jgi:hypothetical protein